MRSRSAAVISSGAPAGGRRGTPPAAAAAEAAGSGLLSPGPVTNHLNTLTAALGRGGHRRSP